MNETQVVRRVAVKRKRIKDEVKRRIRPDLTKKKSKKAVNTATEEEILAKYIPSMFIVPKGVYLGRGGQYPIAFLLQDVKEGIFEIEIEDIYGEIRNVKFQTVKSISDLFGKPLEKDLFFGPFMPCPFKKVVSCNAQKIHAFYT